MWSDFYAAGGWGMHPVTMFGFLLVVVSALYAFRLRTRDERLMSLLAKMTLMSGVLGTAAGICNTAFYLHKVEPVKQVEIFALGLQESLHVVVLALLFVIFAGFFAGIGIVRHARATA